MNNKIYVGNLPWDTQVDLIEDLFGLGERAVREVHMAKDRESGEFRGFAFVTMVSAQRAALAMAMLDGFMIGARAIRVRAAEERSRG